MFERDLVSVKHRCCDNSSLCQHANTAWRRFKSHSITSVIYLPHFIKMRMLISIYSMPVGAWINIYSADLLILFFLFKSDLLP